MIFARLLILSALVIAFACQAEDAPQPANSVAIEALSRLKGMDLEANPSLKAAVLKVIDGAKGTPAFVELIRDFKITGRESDLLDFAAAHPADSISAEAIRLVVAGGGLGKIAEALKGPQTPALVEAAGNAAEKQLVGLIEAVATNKARDVTLRKKALHALAQTQDGSARILALAADGTLPGDLRLAASMELSQSRWAAIKTRAAQELPLPQGSNSEPLPPIAELVKRKGDAAKGAAVFRKPEVNCIGCHQVNGEGMDFGPKLGEIGTKLGKDALYESILDPSAGISFGFEAWQLEMKNGDEAFGLIASETEDEVRVKTQNGIVTPFKKTEIAKRTKMPLSIMPAGLQAAITTEDFVNLVEYLSTLKKP